MIDDDDVDDDDDDDAADDVDDDADDGYDAPALVCSGRAQVFALCNSAEQCEAGGLEVLGAPNIVNDLYWVGVLGTPR
jgi:hypothetical protein